MRKWILILIGLSLSCGSQPEKLVLLITLDTTRADRIGCYGSRDAITPHLDRVAGKGLQFARAWTPVPVTLPAHTSIMTGLTPPVHGVRDNGTFRLAENAVTLAELLADGGYETAAFISAYPLAEEFGLSQGFHFWDGGIRTTENIHNPEFTLYDQRTAGEVTDQAIQYLKGRREGRLFLWVHYFDPHGAYAPPEPWATRFRNSPYDGEIAYADNEIGRLLDAAHREFGGADRLTIITADHGEGLGRHDEKSHGVFIYETTMRVPLIIIGAGIEPGLSPDRVGLIDIAPTILEWTGISGPDWIEGVSLLGPIPDRPVYLESFHSRFSYGWSGIQGVIWNNRKYILTAAPENYDLESDPGETGDLGGEWPREAREALDRTGTRKARFGESYDPDDAARKKLLALGYVTGKTGEQELDPTVGSAPRVEMPLARRMIDGYRAMRDGRKAEASRLFEEILTLDSTRSGAHLALASVQRSRGLYGDAETSLEAAIRFRPAEVEPYLNLAELRTDRGDLESAVDLLREGLIHVVQPATLCYQAALISHEAGEATEAIEWLEKAIALDWTNFQAMNLLAWILLEEGIDTEVAVGWARRASEGSPERADFFDTYGLALYRAGEPEQALIPLGRAVELDPENASYAERLENARHAAAER